MAGVLGLEGENIPKVISDYMPVELGRRKMKDMIKIHSNYELSYQQLEALALLAPKITISYVDGGKVIKKIRPLLGSIVKGRIKCGNKACVTNVKKEGVVAKHLVSESEGKKRLECIYCEHSDTVEKVYSENRFIYINEMKK